MSADTSRGTLSGMSAYLLWGVLTAYWKLLDDFGAFELIGWRVVTAVVLLLALVAVQGKVRAVMGALRNPAMLLRVSLAAVLLAVNWTLYVWAVVNEHVIETALGYFIAPLLTSLLGVAVLREPLRMLQKVAIGFAAASVAVMTLAYGRPPLIALAIAASWGFYGLLKKQVSLGPVESLTAETIVLSVPAMALVAWSFTLDSGIAATASATEWVLVLLTGLITAVPLLLFAHSALRLPLTMIGPLQYIVPVINFLLGWLAYNEDLQPSRVVGFVLVWIGLGLTLVDTTRRRVAVS
ncbi:MAG: EamA family transporter RarD [Actinobacteria bacterium]|jgi:chloramphenicol-sensitive protein RarD|nr:EamA family transporter RarD [Actinomycetota bacterium]NDG76374.1 EamA family transporter RarD [Acidimicrobiia bacterium]NBP17494.1 EamA family transporter RarD [Actinomycetota bacterium]NCY09305.1 EamA family transporter RarD [Actinomycetota bacterium]NDC46855.1 EamA family transporter RarD [Actinomycetota bacterium]